MNRLKRGSAWLAALAAASILAGQAQAKPIAYPAKGQSAQQHQKDDGECYVWAKNSTGIDPAAVAAAPPPPSGPAVGGGERVKGAVGGAVVGGLVGGDSDGARAGAVVGTMAGGARARQKQRAQQSSAQAQQQGAIDTFYRAYSACMEGRGYTIK